MATKKPSVLTKNDIREILSDFHNKVTKNYIWDTLIQFNNKILSKQFTKLTEDVSELKKDMKTVKENTFSLAGDVRSLKHRVSKIEQTMIIRSNIVNLKKELKNEIRSLGKIINNNEDLSNQEHQDLKHRVDRMEARLNLSVN